MDELRGLPHLPRPRGRRPRPARLTPIPAETIFFRDKPSFGDLGVHLSPERKGLLQQPEVPGGDVEIAVDTFDDREFNFQQHRYPGGRGRALVVRDSFSSFLSRS